jgi:eukaryotic-like serine/threonine-protein kinase
MQPKSLPPGREQPAQTLGGWQLQGLIGEGRWARVYAACRQASDAGSGRSDYALKTPKIDSVEDRGPSLAMLHREVQVGTQVSHPHLAPVLEWSLCGEPFLVMPRIEGCCVRTLLEYRRREYGCLIGAAKSLPQSVWIVRQIASALAELHAAGWLHGDVNPENVLVSPQGHATLIDLGLARKLGTRECQAGEVLAGTLVYASPESFLSASALTAESDIYSLGVMLYELLTGQPLFEELDPTAIALAQLRRVPAPVSDVALDVPPPLALLAMRMLAKDPLRRPLASEVVRRLTPLEIELLGV